MSNYKRKIAILGFGAEGKALMAYLKKDPDFRNSKITILDQKLDKNYLKSLNQFDVVFRSPGIPYLLPEIQKAKKAGVKMSSATKLFFERCPCPIIGITGTKGKGTTTTLINKMLKGANKKVFLVGNIGAPAISVLPKIKKNDLVIFELSSFQLQDLKQSPRIAVILGIGQDHLNIHKNFQEYVSAKSNIAKHQNKNNVVIFAKDNPWSKKIAQMSAGKKIGFSLSDKNSLLSKIRSAIKLPGEHNVKNAYAAALAAKQLDVSEKIILKNIKSFRGLPFRLQLIRKNPDIYNDSASTNPESTIAAIKAVNPTILIMGGVNKGLSYKNLPAIIRQSPIRKIYLYGQNRNELYNVLKNTGVQIKVLPDLFKIARKLKNSAKSEVILFSPGSASLDQFKKYQERGEVFNQLIKGV